MTGFASKNVTIYSVEVIKHKPPLSAKDAFHYDKSVANENLKLITNGRDVSKVGNVQSVYLGKTTMKIMYSFLHRQPNYCLLHRFILN